MNKQIKKSLMAVAVGAALATAGVTAANANTLLFPFFSTQGGASSFLLLRSGTAISGTPVAATSTTAAYTSYAKDVHFTWNLFADGNGNLLPGLKTTTPAQTCVHVDNFASMTPNDVLFTEMSGPDPYADNSTPTFLPQGLNGGQPVAGFLVVSDTTKAGAATADASLTGQMIVADPNLGAVWAYNGIDGASSTANDGNFSNISAVSFPLSWYPQGGANVMQQTAWYALAVGDMSADIGAQASWAPSGGVVFSQPYNNDEVKSFSGTTPRQVGCASVYTLSNIMNAAQYQTVAGTGGQLNANFSFNSVTNNTATGVVMVKVDTAKLAANAPWGTAGGTTTVFTMENNLNPAINQANVNPGN